jgi:hypothetical protein
MVAALDLMTLPDQSTEVPPSTSPDAASLPPAAPAAPATPAPLHAGERVELWLETASGWDVRPARVTQTRSREITLLTGNWGLPDSDSGTPVTIRRPAGDGIAEWEGEIVPTPPDTGQDDARSLESALTVRILPAAAAGHLYQRRRSPRLPLDLSLVRLRPLADGVAPATPEPSTDGADDLSLPVARLTDVSACGAGLVVDSPLPQGTTVQLEFELPGQDLPFTLRGRVVVPAVPLHGDVQPQADGLPGFRRGIEFLTTTGSPQRRRLTNALSTLLHRRPSPG